MIRRRTPLDPTARAALALALASLAACRTSALPPSEWPPTDFEIEVFAADPGIAIESGGAVGAPDSGEPGDAGVRYRSFRVWADGTALYREARRTLDGVPDPLPVYRTVALYVLDPRTTRTLSRELYRAGLLGASGVPDENAEAIGPEVRVAWRARGDRGEVSARQRDRGPIDRAIRVIDAYLPDACGFGDAPPDVRRVVEVPAPLTWTAGALDVHVDVFRRRAVDGSFLRQLFALAVTTGSFDIARDALRELEERGPQPDGGEIVDPEEWERDEIAPLRAVLARRAPD